MNDKQEVCRDTDLGTIALPGGNPHLPFPAPCSPAYPPKPGICPSPSCPGVADAPCLPTSPGGGHPAPGPNFHAPAPHPTLDPGAPVQSAAAHHFPAQYQAPAVFASAHAQTDAFASATTQTLNVYFPFHLPLSSSHVFDDATQRDQSFWQYTSVLGQDS